MRKWKWHIGSKMNKCEQVSKQAIKFIELDNECIIFHFKNFWHQEEIEFLSSKILAKLGQAKVLEIIQGADRENIRFTWKIEYYFSLNFDCYSQSCWLEGEDSMSNVQLKSLIKALNIV